MEGYCSTGQSPQPAVGCSANGEEEKVHHLLLFLYVRSAKQPTITGLAFVILWVETCVLYYMKYTVVTSWRCGTVRLYPTELARTVCRMNFVTKVKWNDSNTKGEFVPVHALRACGGVEVLLQSLLSSALDGSWMPNTTPRLLYSRGSSFQYLLSMRLGRHHIQSGHLEEDKNFLPLPGVEPRFVGRPACS
jgi:hypothetical protein